MNYRPCHTRFLISEMDNYHHKSDRFITARDALRRLKRLKRRRVKQVYKTSYRRKYGMTMKEAIALLHTTYAQVKEWDRLGILKHRLKLLCIPEKRKLKQL